MQRKETILIPAQEHESIKETVCDICGELRRGGGHDWERGSYDIDEIIIKRSVGSCYPEGGSHIETEYDICPKCWVQKLVPFMESLGAESRESEHDY